MKNEYFYNDSIAHGFYYGCTVCPVSYTHLDVYKRQESNHRTRMPFSFRER